MPDASHLEQSIGDAVEPSVAGIGSCQHFLSGSSTHTVRLLIHRSWSQRVPHTGIHYATTLTHVVTALERELPITLAGQTAKLYNALEYDEPSVSN